MIVTAFVAGARVIGEDPADRCGSIQHAAEITEYAWHCAGQPGEIIRLLPAAPQTVIPLHAHCRVETVLPFAAHPYIDDVYAGYELPAALLQWLSRGALDDATILLLDVNCLPQAPLARELSGNQAVAQRWSRFPRGAGPFGLPTNYNSLAQFCVNRELTLPGVRLPLLIHAHALQRIAARWLELTGFIRHDVREGDRPPADAWDVALNIACAEYAINVESTELGFEVIRADDCPESFSALRSALSAKRENGEWLRDVLAVQKPGVRQGRVLDQVYLESGSPPHASRLNSSAAEIWLRCDGHRDLWSIANELHDEYDVPMNTMLSDVANAALQLQAQGAITLEMAR